MNTSHATLPSRMLFSLAVLGALVLPLYPDAALGATNLVTNGNFENPVVSHPHKWDMYPSGGSLGWTVEWLSSITMHNGYSRPEPATLEYQQQGHLGYNAYEGQQYAELDSDWAGPNGPDMSFPSSVRIYQDVQTTPGQVYELTFAFSPRPEAPSIMENVLNVKWGALTLDTIARASNSGNQTEWQKYTYHATATASTTRLEFSDGGTPNAVGTYLDDVMLVAFGGGAGTSTGTSTGTTTNPGGGNGTSTATTTNPGGGNGTSTATTTPPTSGGGGSTATTTNPAPGSVIAPMTGGGGGGFSAPSGGGQVLGADTNTLPDSMPTGMPYTGASGNAAIAYALAYLAAIIASEAVIRAYRNRRSA